MASGQSGEALPDALVERIIAMVPFPQIFKARCLSKTWRARFAPIASQDDEVEKALASGFQREVAKWCGNWATYGPLFLVENEECFAYRPATRNWQAIPSLPFEPVAKSRIKLDPPAESRLQLEGALLYGFRTSGLEELYVENILSRDKKLLLRHPNKDSSAVICFKMITDELSGTYKVIIVCRDISSTTKIGFAAQIYYSKSDVWISKKLRARCYCFESYRDHHRGDHADSSSVYSACLECLHKMLRVTIEDFWMTCHKSTTACVNGVLYFAEVYSAWDILAFDVQAGTVELLVVGPPQSDSERSELTYHQHYLTACKGNLFRILTSSDSFFDEKYGFWYREETRVLKIDVRAHEIMQVARFDSELDIHHRFRQAVSDGKLIFVGTVGTGFLDQPLAWHLDEKKWRRFPVPAGIGNIPVEETSRMVPLWGPWLFRPGLNTFVAV